MHRFLIFLASMVVLAASPKTARSQATTPPSVYELMINGESFLIEANRLNKLDSPKQPGVRYEVALRIAPTQRLRLNSVRFEYDWLARVEDDHKRRQRTVRLTHELGFSMRITDLDRPLQPKSRDEVLKILTESVTDTYQGLEVKGLEVGQPRDQRFTGTAGRGVTIHYRDGQNLGRTCLIYVLGGPEFAVSCVIEYSDDDFDHAKGLLRKTLDSFKPIR